MKIIKHFSNVIELLISKFPKAITVDKYFFIVDASNQSNSANQLRNEALVLTPFHSQCAECMLCVLEGYSEIS